MMTTSDIIASVSAFLALLALFRPELASLLRRWRNRIELFPLDRMEIGYAAFGPTLGIVGTLRATNGDQFVQQMSAKVERQKDHLTHEFSWAVFRPFNVQFEPREAQYASGFGMKEDEARPLNVQLFDQETRAAIEVPLALLRDEWLSFLSSKGIILADQNPKDIAKLFDEEFRKAKPNFQGNIYGELTRHFYWEPGAYLLTLAIKTWDPEKTFSKTFKFSLSEDDTRLLKLNCITAMRTICGLQVPPFNFAHPRIAVA